MDKDFWKGKNFSFFSHKACECFPCHKTDDTKNFNCLFCYCPLYALGKNCGGKYFYTEEGIKDCTKCLLPHQKESYGYITEKYKDIAELIKENENK